jgi:hypothetical protein
MGECPPYQAARASASRRWECLRGGFALYRTVLDGVEADLPSNDEPFWAWEIYQQTGDRRDLQLRVRALRRELKPILRGYAGKAPRHSTPAGIARNSGSHATSSRRGQRCGRSSAVKGVQPTDNHAEPRPYSGAAATGTPARRVVAAPGRYNRARPAHGAPRV